MAQSRKKTQHPMIVLYFGTKFKSSGHCLDVLEGELSDKQREYVAGVLDGDTITKYFKQHYLVYKQFKDYAILGVLKSADDTRLGSRTFFCVEGNHSHGEMLSMVRQYDLPRSQFSKMGVLREPFWSKSDDEIVQEIIDLLRDTCDRVDYMADWLKQLSGRLTEINDWRPDNGMMRELDDTIMENLDKPYRSAKLRQLYVALKNLRGESNGTES